MISLADQEFLRKMAMEFRCFYPSEMILSAAVFGGALESADFLGSSDRSIGTLGEVLDCRKSGAGGVDYEDYQRLTGILGKGVLHHFGEIFASEEFDNSNVYFVKQRLRGACLYGDPGLIWAIERAGGQGILYSELEISEEKDRYISDITVDKVSMAAARGDMDDLFRFLTDKEHPADPNALGSDGLEPPLVMAAEYGQVEAAKLLLRHGADISVCGRVGDSRHYGAPVGGLSLLCIVALRGHVEFFDFLIKSGVSCSTLHSHNIAGGSVYNAVKFDGESRYECKSMRLIAERMQSLLGNRKEGETQDPKIIVDVSFPS